MTQRHIKYLKCTLKFNIHIVFAVVYWVVGVDSKDANKLNKLIRKATSAVGSKLEDRMLTKLKAVMSNASHLYTTILNASSAAELKRTIQESVLTQFNKSI